MSKTANRGLLVAIPLDRGSATPISLQIAACLRSDILLRRIMPGAKLPSSRILADEMRVSRTSVTHAFEILRDEGLLSSRVGSGSFVNSRETLAPEPLPKLEKAETNHSYRFLSRRGLQLHESIVDQAAHKLVAFAPDLPDVREFPMRTWVRLLGEVSGRLKGNVLTQCSNAGYEPLRSAIALHLNASRGMACNPSQIIITTGSQQSLDLICRLLIDAGDHCYFEDPGYIGSRAVITANGGTVVPFTADGEGLCIASELNEQQSPRLIFVSPSRQYPLGGTLSLERRKALICLNQAKEAWIVEDDYDHEFRYVGVSPRAIFSLDQHARTIYVGTFSKVLLPPFRLGYIVVPPDLVEAFASARAVVDRHASLIEQMILSEFMTRGYFDAHIRRMRNLYAERQRCLIEGLEAFVGHQLTFDNTETGTHLVLQLADNADDMRLAAEAERAGVVVRPLSSFFAYRKPCPGLILGFSAFTPSEISSGLARLARIRELILPQLSRT